MLTVQIQKRIQQNRNKEWQGKLAKITKVDNTLWQTYKLVGGTKDTIPVLLDPDSDSVSYTDQEKADAFATFFAGIHDRAYNARSPLDEQIQGSVNQHPEQTKADSSIAPHTAVSPQLIRNIIRKLPGRKAPGPDKITTTQLKNLPGKAIVQIYYIIKSCLHISYFPDSWKTAKIIPVPKPGKSKNSLHSYRPISLLNSLSKVFEKVILIQLLKHLNKHNILIPQQFGFREGHSCIHQLLRVTEFAIIEHNKNRCTQLVLLDIAKAFDSVWHDALIYKMHKINTPQHITRIIRSYLSNRNMFVSVKGTNSRLKYIKAGVPQGSILGPLLYNIYTNDIPLSSRTHLAIYADDTAIYTSSWNPSQATKYLQEHLNDILEYFLNWKLAVNPAKTQAITFTRKKLDLSKKVKILGHQVPWTNKVKYLGVTLDSRLAWAPAIEARTRLAYPALRKIYPLISRNSKLRKEIKVTLYKVCIRPVITYGHQVWAAAAKSHIQKTQRVQNKFLRIILNKARGTSINKLHELANIQPIGDYIAQSTSRTYNHLHTNPLISNTGNYNVQELPLKIKIKLPKHATT